MARVDEAEAIAQVARDTFPMACPPELGAASMRAYMDANLSEARFDEHLGHPDRDVIVAEEGDGLVGYALVFFDLQGLPEPEFNVTVDPCGLVSKCYVRPEHHGGGVAARLLEAALERGRERGCGGMWLNVNYANFRAQRFYEKHGWERVGYVDFVVGEQVFHDPVYQFEFQGV